MQTPSKVTLEGFYRGRLEFLKMETVNNPANARVTCRKCGGRIKVVPVIMEIHDAADGQCVTRGESFEAGVPYCPACEELPASRGCVHA